MPETTDARIAAADVLTLLLHNQYALAAAIEEVALWLEPVVLAKPMSTPSLRWKLSMRMHPLSPLEFSNLGNNRSQSPIARGFS